MPRLNVLLTIVVSFLLLACSATAQTRKSTRPFQGEWNWAIYASDKSELPRAYQSMELKEVPQYALDLTLKQKGSRLTGTWGLLARYLAHVDEGDLSGTINGSSVRITLKSNFGGSATIVLTLKGDSIQWKRLKYKGHIYFPEDVILRRLKPGEKRPYEADESEP